MPNDLVLKPSGEASAAGLAEPHPPLVPPAAWRVLVVDDNVDAAETLAMLLHLSGYVTQTAHDGVQALVVAEALRPDVVVLDIGLPLLSGLEVARRLRQQPAGQRMVLVALTGWDQAADRWASIAAGFDAHLVKPCGHEQLLQLLPGLLARRTASGDAPG